MHSEIIHSSNPVFFLQSPSGGLYKILSVTDGSVQPYFIHHPLIVDFLTPFFATLGAPSIAIFSVG
jgi:hypothetical protein